jgi:hypothetical protein
VYYFPPQPLLRQGEAHPCCEEQMVNWLYCKVPSQKATVQGKGTYPLRSEMSALDYLMEAPHRCAVDDANMVATTQLRRGVSHLRHLAAQRRLGI